MTNVTLKPKLVIKAKVTRANGSIEDLGVLSKKSILPSFISKLINRNHG